VSERNVTTPSAGRSHGDPNYHYPPVTTSPYQNPRPVATNDYTNKTTATTTTATTTTNVLSSGNNTPVAISITSSSLLSVDSKTQSVLEHSETNNPHHPSIMDSIQTTTITTNGTTISTIFTPSSTSITTTGTDITTTGTNITTTGTDVTTTGTNIITTGTNITTTNGFITLPVGVIIGASTVLLMIAIGIIFMAAIIPIIGKVQSNRRRHVSEEIVIHKSSIYDEIKICDEIKIYDEIKFEGKNVGEFEMEEMKDNPAYVMNTLHGNRLVSK
jgi:hypothetical protein